VADVEQTEALTGAGTQAASPHALGQIASGSHGASRPSASLAMHARAQARVHLFHAFGTAAPFAAIAMFLILGGEPLALYAGCAGALLLSATNAWLLWATSKPERYQPRTATVVWFISVFAAQPMIYYFGPYSGAIVIDVLGIMFISFGRSRWIATATTVMCVACHLALALPPALGASDPGLLSVNGVAAYRLLLAEVLLVGLLVLTLVLGRWARRTNVAAMAELRSAMQLIGDKEQALAEVKAEAARALRVDEGRWTGQTMGGFTFGLVLGRGGMGEVYEATAGDGTPAAVKLLNARATTSANLVERFHREMEVAARLESPHIVKVLALSGADAPVPFIAMERLHGVDLATRLRDGRLPSDELVVLLDQVAQGLEVARLANIVHRDLKPHNLYLHSNAMWKILDFGVSKLLGVDGTLTGEGIVGTPQYMAPEQASGGEITHRCDVYALGAIAYRCLTGRSPFRGNDLSALVYQVVNAPPERPTTFARLPEAIEDVLAIAMAKQPEQRFASAVELARAFVAARRGRRPEQAVPGRAWKAVS
jgi:serine/threonine-protein kinase